MDILRVENLSMEFGRRRVLDGLSFQVPEHSVFGFVGPNGAGKTTTMKLVLGLLKP
ncbi:MAG: ATP-binding cassette domain-containing protein, partial [Clostridia bacterium]|nr:ATP-binding cassette domain-containing protein [Clostridia bacterium]